MCTGKNVGKSLRSAAEIIASSSKEEGKVPIDCTEVPGHIQECYSSVHAKKACHNSLGALVEQHRKIHVNVS